MESITVESNNEKLTGNKVRYFNFENDNYLIYTLKEIDDEEYEKLYITKIVDNEEEVITDLEWEDLKKKIPAIVKEIKNNKMKDVVDLDIDLVDNVNTKYSKAFKLRTKIVDSIAKEKTIDTIKKIDEDLKSIMDNFNSIEENKVEEFNFDNNLVEEDISNDLVETPLNPNIDKQNKIVDNEELEEEKRKNEELQSRIDELEKKLEKYENIFDKIKIMINES